MSRRQVLLIRMSFVFVIAIFVNFANGADKTPVQTQWTTCDCEAATCGKCEVETGVTFYSAKCGPNDSRVKSCKKPTCVPVEGQVACLKEAGLPGVAASDKASEANSRQPASEPAAEDHKAGVIVNASGTAVIIPAGGGRPELAKENRAVHVGDVVETKADGKVKIVLKDSSEMTVAKNSTVKIEQVQVNAAKGTRNVRLDLLMGKVRNRVVKKFDNENSFTVKTKTAVAGVRGTDFVASFEKGEKDWVSTIHTFEGKVQLENARAKDDLRPPSKSVEVVAGTYASLVIGPPARPDDEDEFFRTIEAGYVTPVMRMKEEESLNLRHETEFAMNTESPAKREVAQATAAAKSGKEWSEDLCQSPAGNFNQCSFTCEGNPPGDKKCRVELPGVACVRRLCRANGSWADVKRMPASQADQCQPGRPIVRDCGSYW